MKIRTLRAPFPWFGGKSRVAHQIWERFGEVRNYVEPFAGSLAVLLGRPSEAKIETVNDVDGYLSNFWRAVAADPEEVARWAEWPVNEVDLHARHRWLVEVGAERVERLRTDPGYFDAQIAGWWVWGQCLWIGSGWCARPEWTGRGAGGRRGGVQLDRAPGKGIHRSSLGKLPAITADLPQKLPMIGGESKGVNSKGRSINPRAGDPIDGHRRRPNGQAMGINASSFGADLPQKRPVLPHGKGARGVHRLAHQVPDLSGDSGAAGRGGLLTYMRALSDRLRRVRVCCGDFERILGPAVTTCIGMTGVFLDPPYPEDGRAICYAHDGEGVWWRAYRWAIEHGEEPLLRIALCGYEHPDAVFPAGWTEVSWKASGGYGRSDRGKANARRERIWFSPGCLDPRGQRNLW